MSRQIIQDIVATKKSIRSIQKSDITNGNQGGDNLYKEKLEKNIIPTKKRTFSDRLKTGMYPDSTVSQHSHLFLWIISITSVAVLLFFLSLIFATATITITPKNDIANLEDENYIVSAVSEEKADGLNFYIMTLKKTLSKNLPTDKEEMVERKATGKVIIYNNHSASRQRLIINTRLEAGNGLLYRTRESVDVPGIKTIDGVKTPGSVEVEVIADIAGEEYNTKVSDFKGDFTIPGFKGYPQYESFYARLSSDITGGLIGNVKVVSEDLLTLGKEELRNNLIQDLVKDMYVKKPEQYIVFQDNYFIEFNSLPDSVQGDDYGISEEAIMYVVMFEESKLAQFIAENNIPNFDGAEVDIIWGDSVVVKTTGTTDKPWMEDSLNVTFDGNANVLWSYDKNTILNGIRGQDKTIIKNVLEKHKDSIVEIQASIRPQWKKSFPENIKKIKIVDVIRDKLSK